MKNERKLFIKTETTRIENRVEDLIDASEEEKVGRKNSHESDHQNIVAQSPIALCERQAEHWEPSSKLYFEGHCRRGATARVTNNGASALVTFSDQDYLPILFGGPLCGMFIFEQLHFHWAEDDQNGSEHSINGKKYAAEAHLVHYNKKYKNFDEAATKPDGLGVTAFFLQTGHTPNSSLQAIADAVVNVKKLNHEAQIKSDNCLSWMLPVDLNESYYTYRGSLTTPPFLESVTWIVYDCPVKVSACQLQPFQKMQNANEKLILCNARSLQPTPNGLRIRYVSSSPHCQDNNSYTSEQSKL